MQVAVTHFANEFRVELCLPNRQIYSVSLLMLIIRGGGGCMEEEEWRKESDERWRAVREA